jgi:hypothetical protein
MLVNFFKRTILVVFLILAYSNIIFGELISQGDLDKLVKMNSIEHIVYETYLDTDQGCTSVFGYHFDVFLNNNMYFNTAIFGAVGGNRGGYGIAAFGLGYRALLLEKLFWDARLLIGSGGGGGLSAGGGLALKGQVGMNYEIFKNLFVDVNVGYLTFPSGAFATPIINVGLSYQVYRLFLPYE